ncbi:probable cytochrome P450 6a13 [Chrysoperla carnea]|uniref:probable cytochrome P450 6a13 n=1 Tax=Chrysoperla carnea TaxID=189513 RepID=UPI001D05F47C|nr:probable cytochrome P450 6a13 [Chrysoperla carnea]
MQYYYMKYKNNHPICGVYEGRNPRYLVLDFNLVKDIFIRDFDHFTDRSLFNFKQADILKDLLLMSSGPIWKPTRAKLTPAFSSGKLKAMDVLIQRCGEQMSQHLLERKNPDEELEMKQFFGLFTLDVISNCAFGIESNPWKETDPELITAFRNFDSMTTLTRMRLLASLVLMPHYFRRFVTIWIFNKKTAYFIANIIRNTREYRLKNNQRRNDFLQLLLDISAQEEEFSVMDVDHVISQSILFMIAGFETSSTLLGFAAYELALNPEVQNTLRAEIKSVLEKHNNVCNYDAVQDMHYLEMVLLETLRKHSPVARIDRCCVKEYKIRGTDIVMEKGMNVSVPVVGFHYDPTYFPNPEKFDPLRFQENRNPDGFLSFGIGPRNCIGKRFALISTKFAMVYLIKDFELKATEKTEVPYTKRKIGILLYPQNGLHVKISKLNE